MRAQTCPLVPAQRLVVWAGVDVTVRFSPPSLMPPGPREDHTRSGHFEVDRGSDPSDTFAQAEERAAHRMGPVHPVHRRHPGCPARARDVVRARGGACAKERYTAVSGALRHDCRPIRNLADISAATGFTGMSGALNPVPAATDIPSC